MTPLERVEAALLDAGCRKGSGQDWFCPVHGGSRASLGVAENEETGNVLLRCQHGCETRDVLKALGLRMSDMFVGPAEEPASEAEPPQPPRAYVTRRPDGSVSAVYVVRSGEKQPEVYPLAGDVAEAVREALDRGEPLPLSLVTGDDEDALPEWATAKRSDAGDVLAAVRTEFLVEAKPPDDFLADLLSDEEVLELPPIEYAVDEWFPKGNYSVLYGEPGIGKTFVLLAAARSVRAGVPWFGANVAAGGALFFQGEGVRQFRTRITAWDEYHDAGALAAGGSFERTFDLTKPEAVAAVIRTVRAFEAREGVAVSLLVIEPLVEFMTGEENGEGMELASRGLRALARLLPGTAIVAGHHSNAAGERERGAAFLRMRAGAFARVERTDDGIALYQHKSRDGEARAVELEPVPVGDSLAFEVTSAGDARSYIAAKESSKKIKRDVEAIEKREAAAELILREIAKSPGIAMKGLKEALYGCGTSGDRIKVIADEMAAEGLIRVEKGPRNASLLYPMETE